MNPKRNLTEEEIAIVKENQDDAPVSFIADLIHVSPAYLASVAKEYGFEFNYRPNEEQEEVVEFDKHGNELFVVTNRKNWIFP